MLPRTGAGTGYLKREANCEESRKLVGKGENSYTYKTISWKRIQILKIDNEINEGKEKIKEPKKYVRWYFKAFVGNLDSKTRVGVSIRSRGLRHWLGWLSHIPGSSFGSPMWIQGPKLMSHLLLLPQAHEQGTRLEIEQPRFEWFSYGIPASQGVF